MIALEEKVNELKAKYYSRVGERDALAADISILQKEIDANKLKSMEFSSLMEVYRQTAEEAREGFSQVLADNVTCALQHVFGPDFKFIIENKESGGRPVTEFYVEYESGGVTLKNRPKDAMGGGVVDIICTGLQVAVKKLFQNPPMRGPMIFDEPGKHVSEEYAVRLGTFLNDISSTYGFQMIINTHQRHLAEQADKRFLVQIRKGASVVEDFQDIDAITLNAMLREMEGQDGGQGDQSAADPGQAQ